MLTGTEKNSLIQQSETCGEYIMRRLHLADAVIFDMDGVIILSEDVKYAAYKDVFRREFLVELDDDDVSWRGKSEPEVMRYWLHKKGLQYSGDIGTLVSEKRNMYRKLLQDGKVELVKGIREFLIYLHDHLRKSLGLATVSTQVDQRVVFSLFGFDEYFSAATTLEDVTHPKPHPEIYLKTAETLCIDPAKCLVFEDSPTGFKAARAAGMEVVPVLTSYQKTDFPDAQFYISDFSQLMSMMKD